jgi:uncharacterized membrane protein
LRGFFVTLIKIKMMNKTTKIILLFIGIVLLIFGICTIIIPEIEISIETIDLAKVQYNTNSYIIIGLGLVAVVLSLLKKKEQ